jgi:hypothetical protein
MKGSWKHLPTKVTSHLTAKTGQLTSSERSRSFGAIAICVVLGIFAVLLLISLRHEMYFDEAQAWFIARDNHSLFDLFHVLHYEAHASVWYLLLFIPAHASSNMELIRVVNSFSAVGMAWLILPWRNQPILIVWSVRGPYAPGSCSGSFESRGRRLSVAK